MMCRFIHFVHCCSRRLFGALVSASAPTASTAGVLVLLLVLQEIFSDAAEQGTSDGSQKTVAGFLAKKMATEGTASGAEETTITLGHGRSRRIVVWGLGVRGLAS